jgi:uncharacterized protein (TIGR00375 family)
MRLSLDLHSHSGYAGGVGQIELTAVSQTMKKKGIDVFGTGDCLYPTRTEELKESLSQKEAGLFALRDDTSRFILQTEVIFSTKLSDYRHKIMAHHVLLFPDFSAVRKMQKLLDNWKMKNTIGRPFIVSASQSQLEEQLFSIQEIDPYIEIIPAHVMTPDGIMGSKNGLSSTKEFYGNFYDNIRMIETGLSADPEMLIKIPDFTAKTMISNSDCHSSALNRIGREFTVIEAAELNYYAIIDALRANRVEFTAEFHPAEGRYYLTGHRAARKDHVENVIFYDEPANGGICPVCKAKMHQGVKARCRELSDEIIENHPKPFHHLIPLIEVISDSLGTRSVQSKKVLAIYEEIVALFNSEIEFWLADAKRIEELLDKRVNPKTINHVLSVKAGKFRFDPPGFDGIYGKVRIGE